ncbi:hypothetical protein LTR10_004447 [Elasticomyces elasticus]|nr:hypothetical protein LTR10_004447 [Elasticomyces elasticus]KAK4976765.1 hypothetical protein LTR42_002810 [Elasticomyces elasticus]
MVASIVKTYEAKALSSVLDYTCASNTGRRWTSTDRSTDDLIPWAIWISIELNVVIIVSSLPLVRPMFVRSRHRRRLHVEQQTQKWDSNSTFGSFMSSKKGPRSNLARVDSEEEIMPQDSFQMQEVHGGAINVTREVMVTYENTNQPFVHAALVGLIEGEIANPKLVQR